VDNNEIVLDQFIKPPTTEQRLCTLFDQVTAYDQICGPIHMAIREEAVSDETLMQCNGMLQQMANQLQVEVECSALLLEMPVEERLRILNEWRK